MGALETDEPFLDLAYEAPVLVPLTFAELIWARWGPELKNFSK